jgi:hypothetical protein
MSHIFTQSLQSIHASVISQSAGLERNTFMQPCHVTQLEFLMMLDNRNIWQQMENPFWWIFLLISLFPYYGVQPFFYAFIFLAIDKGDEYQLVSFILNYKKLQFFTQGVVSGVIGYALFYGCIDYGKYTSNADFQE